MVDLVGQLADKFEVMRNISLGLTRKEKEEKGGNVRKVRSKEGITCYRCQKSGHFSNDCKTPRSSLKCTHCKTKQKHDTNDFCKDRHAEKGKKNGDEKKASGEAGKANKVSGRDPSPAGDDEEEGKVSHVKAGEGQSKDSQSDYDGEGAFANQCVA